MRSKFIRRGHTVFKPVEKSVAYDTFLEETLACNLTFFVKKLNVDKPVEKSVAYDTVL